MTQSSYSAYLIGGPYSGELWQVESNTIRVVKPHYVPFYLEDAKAGMEPNFVYGEYKYLGRGYSGQHYFEWQGWDDA